MFLRKIELGFILKTNCGPLQATLKSCDVGWVSPGRASRKNSRLGRPGLQSIISEVSLSLSDPQFFRLRNGDDETALWELQGSKAVI